VTAAEAKVVLRTNESIRTWTLGRKINWSKPPKATTIVRWLHRGRTYKMSFRTACAMARLNNLALAKFGKQITVIQPCFNTGVPASAGTHDLDATFDLWIDGVDPWAQQAFFRRNGFACWFRHPPLFGNHIHGFVLPVPEGQSRSDDFKVRGFKVGIYVDGGYSTKGGLVTSSQIADYYNESFGLAGQHTSGSDNSWFPDNKAATVFQLQPFIERRKRDAERAARVRKRKAA
jgi:hypothetical protein